MPAASTVYRVTPLLRLMGAAGLAFVGYIFVCKAGAIDLILFARVQEFCLTEPGAWLYLLLMIVASLAALWLSAARVTLTDESITYSAPARRVVIQWREVTELMLWMGPQVRLVSTKACIRLNGTLVQFGRLRADIVKRADPSVVKERRIQWFGQWRERILGPGQHAEVAAERDYDNDGVQTAGVKPGRS